MLLYIYEYSPELTESVDENRNTLDTLRYCDNRNELNLEDLVDEFSTLTKAHTVRNC